jgi:hypothetical protein
MRDCGVRSIHALEAPAFSIGQLDSNYGIQVFRRHFMEKN